jgi:TatA/E family protein of Tat protein translocase
MGGSEILLILLAILVLFGADKLPGFARSLGKGISEIKKASDEIKEDIARETSSIKKDVENTTSEIKENTNVSKEIKDKPNNGYPF